MPNKIPCELIQDLFPSYIEGLTSEVSNTMIEEHLAGCEDCKKVLECMKESPDLPAELAEADRKEIDFLKKTRKKNHRIIVGSILAAAAIIAAVLTAKTFLIGNLIYEESVVCQVQVEENRLTLNAAAIDEDTGISGIDYDWEDGVVTVSFCGVKKSPFYGGEYQSAYTAEDEIERVCVGDRIIWDHGQNVSALASAVFNSRHAYIGNMPENGQTASVLNIASYLGNFTNTLQTVKQPYGWILTLKQEISASQKAVKEELMRNYAYILLAVIENLGEVSYEYTVDGEDCVLSVTEGDATAFAEQDIKNCGQDVLLLQELIKKTGLDK